MYKFIISTRTDSQITEQANRRIRDEGKRQNPPNSTRLSFPRLSSQFAIDTLQGLISVGQTPLGKQWVYLFQARATDYQGHVTSVPVTVYIIGQSFRV